METKIVSMSAKIADFLIALGIAELPKIPEAPKAPEPVKPENKGDFKNPDFQFLWDTCVVRPEYASIAKRVAAQIKANKPRYDVVAAATGAPWYFVGLTHYMECSLSFEKHLHNGDPLTARTKRVPAGYPKKGEPPFTWEESAIDAMMLKPRNMPTIISVLQHLERYNGLGYRNKGIYSPYLWSFTNHYSKGKYTMDSKFSPEAVSKQVGCAAILKELLST
jgi:lysozyme family protein